MAIKVKPGYLVSATSTLLGSIVGLIAFISIGVKVSEFRPLAENEAWNVIGSFAIAGWWLGSILCCWLSLKLLKYEKARSTAIWVAGLMILNAACPLFSLKLIWFTLLPFTFGIGGLARWIVMQRSQAR